MDEPVRWQWRAFHLLTSYALLPAGESVPVRKVPYNPSVEGSGYCPDKHSSCTLYGGTQVAQARAPGTSYSGLGLSPSASTGGCALAMVARTRFYSAKGQLLRCAGWHSGCLDKDAGHSLQRGSCAI